MQKVEGGEGRLKTINQDGSRFVHVRESTYRICFLDMSKCKATKLMINSNLIDEIKILWMIINKNYCDHNENENDNDNDNDNDNKSSGEGGGGGGERGD